MSETRIEVETPDGRADGRLFLPDGAGPWPLVVCYMDAGGLRPAMSATGQRLAAAGYAVVQPNLYWRSGPHAPFDAATVFSDPAERARLMALAGAVRADQVMSDTSLVIAQLAADPRIRTERLRFVGYCLGGRMTFVAASAFGDRVAAAAAIHAARVVTDAPDSPHLGAASIRGKLYLGVADQDASFSPEHQQAVREALDAAGVDYTLEVYPGALHGFAMPDFPVYDPKASEQHWDRVLALFAQA